MRFFIMFTTILSYEIRIYIDDKCKIRTEVIYCLSDHFMADDFVSYYLYTVNRYGRCEVVIILV